MGLVVFATCLLFGAPADEPYPLAEVRFVGNVALEDSYYRARLLEWGYGSLEPLIPKRAAKRLEDHLYRNSYTLARVAAETKDGRVIFHIDEGRLAKIAFFGGGTGRTVQLQLLMSFPKDVFNRRLLNEYQETFRTKLGVRFKYEVVEQEREHKGMQLGTIIDGTTAPRHELHIYLEQSPFDDGWIFHLDINSTDGVLLGLSYGDHALFFKKDEWRLRVDVGANFFRETPTFDSRVGLSRGVMDARWHTPPFWRDRLRTFVWAYGDYLVRQRPLEEIDFYRWVRTGGLINLGFEWKRGQNLAIGVGGELRTVPFLQQPPDAARPISAFSEWRLLSVLQSELIFDVDNPRDDRHHQLEGYAKYFRNADGKDQWALFWEYQFVHEIGWHDFWVKSRGTALAGDFGIMDEDRVSQHIRALFPLDFSPRIFGVSGEFRYSVWRDIFKLAVFVDSTVYEPTRFGTVIEPVRFATGAGGGVCMLLLDSGQIDVYYGGGWVSDDRWYHAIAMEIRKAY